MAAPLSHNDGDYASGLSSQEAGGVDDLNVDISCVARQPYHVCCTAGGVPGRTAVPQCDQCDLVGAAGSRHFENPAIPAFPGICIGATKPARHARLIA